LLPAYACTVGVPLAYYLLRGKVRGTWLVARLALVSVALGGTALFVGWVNGPVAGVYPSSNGTVFLYVVLAALAWFVALPFLSLGLHGGSTPDGYAALFDEAWRLAITLAFALVFTQVFWGQSAPSPSKGPASPCSSARCCRSASTVRGLRSDSRS